MFIRMPNGGTAHVSIPAAPVSVVSRGKTYWFSIHPYCGPSSTDKNGNDLRRQHPLHAFEALGKQEHRKEVNRRISEGLRLAWARRKSEQKAEVQS